MKVYIVFQTGLEALSVHNTEQEAREAMARLDLSPLSVEEWDEAEAREAYPELF
jgi:hypothetical protein